ncbi:hypothetical protein PtB15_3B555 [Puccinia triticina]|nr:hypothetical protein PtB15_3B555 [Puccinia triticina]
MSVMVIDSRPTVPGTSVSVIWTGLELFVLVPSSTSSSTSPSWAADTRNPLRLAHLLAVSPRSMPSPPPPSRHRRLAVHRLLFPSSIPVVQVLRRFGPSHLSPLPPFSK